MKNRVFPSCALVAAYVFCLSSVLVSCHKSGRTAAAVDTMKVDTLGFSREEANVSVKYSVDYPAEGSEPLLHAVREFVSETLGDAYTGNLSVGDSLVSFYGQSSFDSLKKDMREYGGPSDMSMVVQSSVKKIYDTDRLVTFLTETYTYLGGAHGGTTISAATFRKSDGRRFGSDILKDYYSEAFTEAVKDGLKRYFKVRSDADLEACLLDVQVYNIPLPKNPPYFTQDGLTFVYQQYEIAPYAAGMPTFSIPYDVAKGLLLHAAADLIDR